MKTLYHHVKYPQNLHLEKGVYYYCHSEGCFIGYFSSEFEILKQELREFQNIQQQLKILSCKKPGKEIVLVKLVLWQY